MALHKGDRVKRLNGETGKVKTIIGSGNHWCEFSRDRDNKTLIVELRELKRIEGDYMKNMQIKVEAEVYEHHKEALNKGEISKIIRNTMVYEVIDLKKIHGKHYVIVNPDIESEHKDTIKRPAHYHRNEIDPHGYMRKGFPKEGSYTVAEGFHIGNVIKYVSRYKDKNGLEDLYKARENLNILIELEEGE